MEYRGGAVVSMPSYSIYKTETEWEEAGQGPQWTRTRGGGCLVGGGFLV